MSDASQARSFYESNRQKLRKADSAPDLILIAGHSLLQASADRAYPFTQDSSFFYLTGLEEPGLMLVIDRHEEYLIVPERSQARIAFEGPVETARLAEISGVSQVLGAVEGWQKLAKRLREAEKAGVLMPSGAYFESIDMFANPSRQRLIGKILELNNTIEFVDLRQKVAGLRMIKNQYEIKMIRTAIKHTVKLFEIIEGIRGEAGSEHEIMAEVSRQKTLTQLEYAYEPIIASGLNAVTLHYGANNSVIDAKSPLLLDIGLANSGYAADITRTVSQNPTARQQEIYNAALDVQAFAISLLKPGILIKDYEKQVRELMAEKLAGIGLIKKGDNKSAGEYYPHATSHFLGLDVHDAADYERPLEAGMVLTVEPGIYIKDEKIGVRIEDDILITSSGCEVLTKELPHNLASLTIAA